MEYLHEKLNTEYIIKGSGPRKEMLELPEEALKEALLNALAHRDYYGTTPIAVEIFSDRLDIVNPGGLVKGLSTDDLGKRSLPRNNLLFGLFQRMDLVEQAGTGIARIKNEMSDYHLPPPILEIDDNWFVISFKRPKTSFEQRTQKATYKATDKATDKTTDKENEVLDLIRNDPEITQAAMAEKLGLTVDGIRYHTDKLKQKGMLKRAGGKKEGKWEIIRKNKDK